MPIQRVTSLHTFTMEAAFAHEDEGTAISSPSSVKDVMSRAKTTFPGVVTAHQLGRSLKVILSPLGIGSNSTLLATSFSGDEVNRDVEDELRAIYGQNFNLGGIGGFPFGGLTAFGSLAHHVPENGTCLIVYGPHVGIDFDGVVGKVNRRGHHGSGACCNTALASLAYVKAVRSGEKIHSPDPSDPIDAQQVFVDSALLEHGERLEKAENPNVELPHAMFDCIEAFFKRLMDKCARDFPDNVTIVMLGGIIVNTPEGTPEYFLPKKFDICDSNGEVMQSLLGALIEEGNKDIKTIIKERQYKEKMEKAKSGQIEINIKP